MIGIIPAAGHSTRMYGLPKFLLPIADSYLLHILMTRMYSAGARSTFVLTREENERLIDRLLNIYMLFKVDTKTMNETLLVAQDSASDENVLFGMPDTYWTDEDVYQRLTYQLGFGDAIATVALWDVPEQYRHKRGMVAMRPYGTVADVIDKPEATTLTQGWGAMAWSSTFWQYILPEDAHVGYALQRAIDDGQKVQGVVMDGQFWDCGTPDEYFECIRSIEQHRHETASVKA